MENDISILVIDSNNASAHMTREALEAIGMKKIKIVSSLGSARAYLEHNNAIFIVIDRKVGGRDSLEFVRWLRGNFTNQNFKTPILMLMTNPTKEDVTASRDAGITEFLAKPFVVESLKKIVLVILENPRNFIISRNFIGPDRRRKKLPPPDGVEKRKE